MRGVKSGEAVLEPRIIKTDEQYRRFLSEVERLAAEDPDPESQAGTRLELLAKLVEEYEKTRFPFEKPDPIDAILFRMEQRGLRQKDIAELLGGKNRASEVLARKRPLTLSMIRSLYEQLEIPAGLLIREPESPYGPSASDVDLSAVPTREILQRRWVNSATDLKDWIRGALAPIGSPAYLKHTLTVGATASTNRTKIWLWLARAREVAESRTYLHGRYTRESLNEESLTYLVKLSWMERGPQLAREFLEERGVAVVIEPHLKGSALDGAALLSRSGAPIIGLTVRHNRLDNFWFTLLHECAHAWKHLNASGLRAIADLDIERPESEPSDIENEANFIAAEALLPRGVWRRSEAYRNPSAEAIHELASKHQISPAIVAGRLRFERKDYRAFSRLIGNGQVRRVFPEVAWEVRQSAWVERQTDAPQD
jgi:HTH-type transcriptional regulator/antitoxin HigA